MLNKTKDGDITFTFRGRIVATIDRIAAHEMSAYSLIIFENNVRRQMYEDSRGFYSVKNEHDLMRQLESNLNGATQERLNYFINELSETPERFEAARKDAIDI